MNIRGINNVYNENYIPHRTSSHFYRVLSKEESVIMGKITPLKVVSMVIGVAGFFVAAELQR